MNLLEKDVQELQSLELLLDSGTTSVEVLKKLSKKLMDWHNEDFKLRMIIYKKLSDLELGTEVQKAHQNLISFFSSLVHKMDSSLNIEAHQISLLFYAILGIFHSLESLQTQANLVQIENSIFRLIAGFIKSDL